MTTTHATDSTTATAGVLYLALDLGRCLSQSLAQVGQLLQLLGQLVVLALLLFARSARVGAGV